MVICEYCRGAVDVPSGQNLRCGCGKTIQARPLHEGLPELMALMIEHKALRVRTAAYEVELSPEAFAPLFLAQDATPPPAPADEQCTCGHPLHDHTQAGCVMGCDIETCGRAEPS